jgi:hypothetical protein
VNDPGPRSPATKALDVAELLLVTRAHALGLSFEYMHRYENDVFAGGGESASARLDSNDLLTHARGLQIGRYGVVLALLPEAPSEEAVSDVVRRTRNQCVVARSYMSPSAALDLHAILLSPRGSEGVDRWRALALIAERDERVARKLVWLRPTDSQADQASFDDFAKRTFLARPWITDEVYSMAPLDNVSRAARLGDIPRDTASEWIRLATELEADPNALVEGMVEAWQRRSAR